jgi:hypothetical protein
MKGLRIMALTGLDPDRYSGMPGLRKRRETTGWDFRNRTIELPWRGVPCTA